MQISELTLLLLIPNFFRGPSYSSEFCDGARGMPMLAVRRPLTLTLVSGRSRTGILRISWTLFAGGGGGGGGTLAFIDGA